MIREGWHGHAKPWPWHPALLARYKARLKEQGDLFHDDLNVVRIEP